METVIVRAAEATCTITIKITKVVIGTTTTTTTIIKINPRDMVTGVDATITTIIRLLIGEAIRTIIREIMVRILIEAEEIMIITIIVEDTDNHTLMFEFICYFLFKNY